MLIVLVLAFVAQLAFGAIGAFYCDMLVKVLLKRYEKNYGAIYYKCPWVTMMIINQVRAAHGW